jgi:hypothetical protein
MKLSKLARAGIVLALLCTSGLAVYASKTEDAEHRKKDITKHRTIALAHENAAKCLEGGKPEKVCQEELRKACTGLAIGKYCGMKHEH